MQDFVECDSAGTILGTSIATKLAGKTGLITAASMRLSRYSDGYGTQSVRLRRATIAAIPNQGNHTDTSYSDAGDGLPAQDSMGQNTTKWCFGGDLESMLNIIQWLMDDNVVCLHYGMSEVSHYYGTNGGATKRPMLKVELTITEPTLSTPTVTAPGTVTDSPHTFTCSGSTDAGEFVDSGDITYQWQFYDGAAWCDELTHESAAGVLTYALDLKAAAHLNLQALQYYYSTAIKVRVRAHCVYETADYYSSWGESAAFAVDYRITPAAPAVTLKRDTGAVTSVYEGETADVAGTGIELTIARPATYNSHESDGDLMGFTYAAKWQYGDTAITGTFDPALPDSEDASVDLPFAVADLADGANKADRVTKLMAMATPSEGTASAWSESDNITIKRFQKPAFIAWMIARRETETDIGIYVTDTGYDYSTRVNTQIAKVESKVGAGAYSEPALAGWTGADGLRNSFTITGLDPKTQYTITVKVTNDAPAAASTLSDTESDEITIDVRQYQHAGYGAYRPDATGDEAKNLWHTPALLVHSSSEEALDEGCAVIENDLDVGGDLRMTLNRQDDTTDNVVSNQLVQRGWGFITGNGTSYYIEKQVTFPVEYDDGEVDVYCNIIGAKLSSGPTSRTDGTQTVHAAKQSSIVDPYTITAAGFKAVVSRKSSDGSAADALTDGARYMYSWIAIGTKAPA